MKIKIQNFLIVVLILIIISPFVWRYFYKDIPTELNLLLTIGFILLFLLVINLPKICKWFWQQLKKLFDFISKLEKNDIDKNKLKRGFYKGLRLMRCFRGGDFRKLSQRTLILNLDREFNENAIISNDLVPIIKYQKKRIQNKYTINENSKNIMQCESKKKNQIWNNIKFFCVDIFEFTFSDKKYFLYKTDKHKWLYYSNHLFMIYNYSTTDQLSKEEKENWHEFIKIACKFMVRYNDKVLLVVPENTLEQRIDYLQELLEKLIHKKIPIYILITKVNDIEFIYKKLTEVVGDSFYKQSIGYLNNHWMEQNKQDFHTYSIDEICNTIKDHTLLFSDTDNAEQIIQMINNLKLLSEKFETFCNNHFKIIIDNEYKKAVHAIRGVYIHY